MTNPFYIELKKYDSDYNLVQYDCVPFNSFLINWVKYEYVNRVANGALAGCTDASGSTFTQQVATTCVVNAPAGISQYGIVVGSGTTDFTGNEYAIESLINHGSSANRLLYGTGSVSTPTVSSNRNEIRIDRGFTNNSGSDVFVKEIGLYGWTTDTLAQKRYIAITRDTIPSYTLTNGEYFEVRYVFQVSTV